MTHESPEKVLHLTFNKDAKVLCDRQNNSAPKDVYVLISRTCGICYLTGQKKLQLRTLRWKIILDYSCGPNIITRVLISERERQAGQRGSVTIEVEARMM